MDPFELNSKVFQMMQERNKQKENLQDNFRYAKQVINDPQESNLNKSTAYYSLYLLYKYGWGGAPQNEQHAVECLEQSVNLDSTNIRAKTDLTRFTT